MTLNVKNIIFHFILSILIWKIAFLREMTQKRKTSKNRLAQQNEENHATSLLQNKP